MSNFVGDWILEPRDPIPSVGIFAVCDVYRRDNYSTRFVERKAGKPHYFIDGVEVDEAAYGEALQRLRAEQHSE